MGSPLAYLKIRHDTLRSLVVNLIAVFTLAAAMPAANADPNMLSMLEGYTVVKVTTISGRIDKGKREDDFNGCDFDRTILFDDGSSLRCSSYSYTYSYRPRAAIFAKAMSHQGQNFYSVKMLVGSTIYDMGAVPAK